MTLARGICRRTKKKRYPDELGAKMALATIIATDRDRGEGKPFREYKCEFCKGYHLTRQEKRS